MRKLVAGGMRMDGKVLVVGAGPYGLSLAAHLRARGVEHAMWAGAWMRGWRICRRRWC